MALWLDFLKGSCPAIYIPALNIIKGPLTMGLETLHLFTSRTSILINVLFSNDSTAEGHQRIVISLPKWLRCKWRTMFQFHTWPRTDTILHINNWSTVAREEVEHAAWLNYGERQLTSGKHRRRMWRRQQRKWQSIYNSKSRDTLPLLNYGITWDFGSLCFPWCGEYPCNINHSHS